MELLVFALLITFVLTPVGYVRALAVRRVRPGR